MQAKPAKYKSNRVKTILLILGVIIAIILSLNVDVFDSNTSFLHQSSFDKKSNELKLKKEGKAEASFRYNSATTLFKLLTEHSPFLNNH